MDNDEDITTRPKYFTNKWNVRNFLTQEDYDKEVLR
jgi:hypothetical protein